MYFWTFLKIFEGYQSSITFLQMVFVLAMEWILEACKRKTCAYLHIKSASKISWLAILLHHFILGVAVINYSRLLPCPFLHNVLIGIQHAPLSSCLFRCKTPIKIHTSYVNSCLLCTSYFRCSYGDRWKWCLRALNRYYNFCSLQTVKNFKANKFPKNDGIIVLG